jgi:hypothetical protein
MAVSHFYILLKKPRISGAFLLERIPKSAKRFSEQYARKNKWIEHFD